MLEWNLGAIGGLGLDSESSTTSLGAGASTAFRLTKRILNVRECGIADEVRNGGNKDKATVVGGGLSERMMVTSVNRHPRTSLAMAVALENMA